MQSFSAFGCDNTEIAAYHWFRRFGSVFGSDTKLIDPSFCISQDSLMANTLAKFQRIWLRQYRDRRLSVIRAIQARIWAGTKLIDPSCCITQDSLMANLRVKFQRFWLLGFDKTEKSK